MHVKAQHPPGVQCLVSVSVSLSVSLSLSLSLSLPLSLSYYLTLTRSRRSRSSDKRKSNSYRRGSCSGKPSALNDRPDAATKQRPLAGMSSSKPMLPNESRPFAGMSSSKPVLPNAPRPLRTRGRRRSRALAAASLSNCSRHGLRAGWPSAYNLAHGLSSCVLRFPLVSYVPY